MILNKSFYEKVEGFLGKLINEVRSLDKRVDLLRILIPWVLLLVMCVMCWFMIMGYNLRLRQDIATLINLIPE